MNGLYAGFCRGAPKRTKGLPISLKFNPKSEMPFLAVSMNANNLLPKSQQSRKGNQTKIIDTSAWPLQVWLNLQFVAMLPTHKRRLVIFMMHPRSPGENFHVVMKGKFMSVA